MVIMMTITYNDINKIIDATGNVDRNNNKMTDILIDKSLLK